MLLSFTNFSGTDSFQSGQARESESIFWTAQFSILGSSCNLLRHRSLLCKLNKIGKKYKKILPQGSQYYGNNQLCKDPNHGLEI